MVTRPAYGNSDSATPADRVRAPAGRDSYWGDGMTQSVTIQIDRQTERLLYHFDEELKPALIAGMELTMAAAEAEVVKYTPVDQGILRASVYGRVVDQWPKITGLLGSPLAYAEPVEYGSRPHWPPRAPIESWVHRTFGVSGKAMMRIAFLVARAISKRGGYGHFMFTRGLEMAERVGPRFIEAAVRRVEQTLSDR